MNNSKFLQWWSLQSQDNRQAFNRQSLHTIATLLLAGSLSIISFHPALGQIAANLPNLKPDNQGATGRLLHAQTQSIPALVGQLNETTFDQIAATLHHLQPTEKKQAVATLVSLLRKGGSHTPSVSSEQAAVALGILGPDAIQAVPELVALVSDKTKPPNIRGNAASALGYLGLEANRVVPALLTIARNKKENPGVRSSAINAIGEFGKRASTAVAPMIAMLNDKTEAPGVRSISILNALGKIGANSPTAISTLVSLLDDKNQKKLGLPSESFWGVSLTEELATQSPRMPRRQDIAIALAGMGHTAVPELIKALKNPDEKVRYSAAFVLGEIQPPATTTVAPLQAILNTPNENLKIRWMAASALESLGQDTRSFFSRNKLKSLNALTTEFKQGCPNPEMDFVRYFGRCKPSGLGGPRTWQALILKSRKR